MIFSGCEKIDNPYYFVDPVPIDSLSAESFKKVLLEDFTGMLCVNCPAAARLAEDIAASSRHRVIVMGIHAGHLAKPSSPPFTLDLRCPEGNAYYDDFKITGNPKGLVNRIERSAGIFEYASSEWAEAITSELEQPLTFKLKVEGTLTEDGTGINAEITYTATATTMTDYNLLVFLVEDGIVGVQKDGPEIKTDYVFHNVLRETLHDAYYGIPIENPVAGVEYSYPFDNYKIKTIDQKDANSTYNLIVVVTQRDSKYIEQVEEIGLK
jgi:nicotinamidase-related amidase